jgi:hypothetical protein
MDMARLVRIVRPSKNLKMAKHSQSDSEELDEVSFKKAKVDDSESEGIDFDDQEEVKEADV